LFRQAAQRRTTRKEEIMNSLQRLFVTLLPKKWTESMEAESRAWIVHCPCGFERSMWEAGGIRWKAAGKPRQYFSCPRCRKSSWHFIYKKGATEKFGDIRTNPAQERSF
jgi:hypothetical protein